MSKPAASFCTVGTNRYVLVNESVGPTSLGIYTQRKETDGIFLKPRECFGVTDGTLQLQQESKLIGPIYSSR